MIQEEVTEVLTSGQALVGAGVVAGGLLLLRVALRLGRRLYPEPPEVRVPWNPIHVGLVVVVVLAASLLGNQISMQVSGVASADELPFLTLLLGLALGMGAGALLVVLIARRMRAMDGLGLGRGGDARAAFSGAAIYLLCAPLIYAVTFIWPWVMEQFGREAKLQDVARGFLELEGGPLVLGAVLAVLVIPLIEELLFRGFLLPVLVRHLGTAAGLVGTSLLFGILHGIDVAVPIACLALVLGWVQLRTGRLAAAWAVHAVHNGVLVAIIVLWPEML